MLQPFAAFPHHPLLLVGSSLGTESDDVVRAALALARAGGGRIHLVHALEPPPSAVPGGAVAFGLLAEGLAAERRDLLDEQLARLGAVPAEVAGVHVEPGSAHEVISRVAGQTSPALLVVGALGGNALPMQRLGSTAMHLLRDARQPVLVVKAGLTAPPKVVLAPVDLSLLAGDSLRCGLALLAAVGGARPPALVAVHVMEPTSSEPHVRPSAELDRFMDAHTEGYTGHVTAQVRRGATLPEIVAAAERHGADLVLLGTHGRSGWRRMKLGSVAEAVVKESVTSVLVVPPAAALAGAVAEAVLAGTAGGPG
jgi:nucleotide-binding universal stress UspA family protein